MKRNLLLISAFALFLVFTFQQSSLHAQGGNALDFDGNDDLVSIISTGTAINTLEFYINSPVAINGTGTVSLPFGFNAISRWIGFNNVTGGLAGETLTISSGAGFTATNTPIPAGWHHIALVSNGGVYDEIYIDGVLANMIATASPVMTNAELYIGGNPLQAGFFFAGQIDEVRLWTISRLQADIQTTLNQELTGGEAGLFGYYNFNIGTANGDNGSSCPAAPCEISLPDLAGAGVGSLSGFALNGSASNWVNSTAPLPVEFLSFTGSNISTGIELAWETTQEINNKGFEIQYSTDLDSWQELGFIEGKGAGNQTNSYNFLHTAPIKGLNYYRIKQIDVDGVFDFSDMLSIYSSGLESINVYPSPNLGKVFIDGLSLVNSRYQVLDTRGKILKKGDLNENHLDLSDLAGGIYFLNIYDEGAVFVRRIVKN